MRRQKVLILCPIFPPHRFGGVEKIAFELTKKLSRSIKAYVVTTQLEDGKELPLYQNYYDINVYRIAKCNINFPDFNFTEIIHKNTLLLEKAIKVIKDNPEISVIHAHDWFVGLAAMSLKNIFSLPLVSTFHGCKLLEHQNNLNPKHQYIIQVQRQLLTQSDLVTTYSQFMKDALTKKYSFPTNKIKVFSCGVDECKVPLAKGHNKIKKVLYLGRFAYEKNIENLLKAFKIVVKFIPNCRLILVGKGPLKQQYLEIINSLKIKSYTQITEFISDQKKIDRLYRNVDVFILPSIFEPFGLTVLEAVVRKVPVIISQVGGPVEVIKNNISGLTINPYDPKDIANKIIYLLQNHKIATRLSQNAYKDVIKKYNWQKASNFFEEVYTQIKKIP